MKTNQSAVLSSGVFIWQIHLPAIITWATSVAVSRVMLGRHYVLDVLVGAIVGYLVAIGLVVAFQWPS